MLLTSCDIETSDNGDLDGYWHLVQVDTLATGNSSNLSETRVFWGVQMHLIQAVDHDHDPGHYGYLFNFEHNGQTLRLYNAHKHARAEGDLLVEDSRVLAPLGINTLDDLFTIEKLNSDNLILKDHLLRLWFKKM
jgi:hypothetical protein